MTSVKGPNSSCWTCRLRRKKCDEELPLCATCKRLEIECFPSYEKPEFMDGGSKEKQKSIEIRALVKAKNDGLRRSRAPEAKRRQQCHSQETTNSSKKDISRSRTMRSESEKLLESLIAVSSPPAVSSLQSMSLVLNNQDSRELEVEPVCCERWLKYLIDEVDTLSMEMDKSLNKPDEIPSFQFKADRLQDLLKAGVRDSHLKCVELTAIKPGRSIQRVEAEMHSRRIEVSLVTCLFASAALIYLHIMLHGTDAVALPTANKLLFEWIFNFRFFPECTLLSDLAWPFCITGCMATTVKQQQFLRETVITSGIDRLSTCMIWRALYVMEMCWKVSTSEGMQPGGINWTRAVKALRD